MHEQILEPRNEAQIAAGSRFFYIPERGESFEDLYSYSRQFLMENYGQLKDHRGIVAQLGTDENGKPLPPTIINDLTEAKNIHTVAFDASPTNADNFIWTLTHAKRQTKEQTALLTCEKIFLRVNAQGLDGVGQTFTMQHGQPETDRLLSEKEADSASLLIQAMVRNPASQLQIARLKDHDRHFYTIPPIDFPEELEPRLFTPPVPKTILPLIRNDAKKHQSQEPSRFKSRLDSIMPLGIFVLDSLKFDDEQTCLLRHSTGSNLPIYHSLSEKLHTELTPPEAAEKALAFSALKTAVAHLAYAQHDAVFPDGLYKLGKRYYRRDQHGFFVAGINSYTARAAKLDYLTLAPYKHPARKHFAPEKAWVNFAADILSVIENGPR